MTLLKSLCFRRAVGFLFFNAFHYTIIGKRNYPANKLPQPAVGRAAVARVMEATVNQRRGGKARERWQEQGGTWGLVAGLFWCVGLLLPMDTMFKQ